MSSDYSFDQIAQLVASLRKNGWTKEYLTKLGQCGEQKSSSIRTYLDGLAEITQQTHIIDCDANPLIPYEGWKVEEHKKGRQFVWDPTKVRLHLSPNLAEGKSIVGNKLRKELDAQPVFNANLLDYLVEHPHLIPEEWKVDEKGRTRYIFFWGTIYRNSDGNLCVRCLCWHGGHWQVGNYWLGYVFVVNDPAAVSAS